MPGIPDSTGGSEDWTLEEYIKETEREHDEEVRKSIRLWHWQDSGIMIIGVDINTNAAEIVNRAYSMGLRKLRDDVGDEVQEVNEMVVEFLRAVDTIYEDSEATMEVRSDIVSKTIELDDDFGNLSDPRAFPLKDSELSEVRDIYTEKNIIGGWIHRAIIALGMKESENIGDESVEIISSLRASINNKVEDAREYLERRIKNFVGQNMGSWLGDGVQDETVEHLRSAAESMETRHGDEVMNMIDAVDRSNTE